MFQPELLHGILRQSEGGAGERSEAATELVSCVSELLHHEGQEGKEDIDVVALAELDQEHREHLGSIRGVS